MREGKWETHYRYVLVDEFQDISAGRMKLLQALNRDDTAYFLVGDDWQSINRFAGSDVGLLRNCGDYLGHVQIRTLNKTFRFGDGILGPSTEFVLSNPEQWKRTLTSASVTVDRGITVIYEDPAAGLQRAREDIQTSAPVNGHSVLVLGRYKSSEKALQGKTPSDEFSTVHRAKGRESDYLVVLDLKDGRWGFPSKVEDDPLLELVLPPASGGGYPFAEERRLFYVAMTRARIG
ncbi:MAG: UvrD-helicase domain-containing protein, partial [Chloroflexi bacterium]|nr:UvrD-helicase domain-containing protein [Chloroflexota bacterium]